MSKKSLTPEDKQREEDEAFMRGTPNRMEVASYVNALLEEHYLPEIQKMIAQVQQSTQLGFMTLQAILINKKICSGEEIQQITQEFIRVQKDELEKKLKEQTEKAKSELESTLD